MLHLAWMRDAPLDSMQGLLLLFDAVDLGGDGSGVVDGGRDGGDLVGRRDDVRLVAGSSREVGGANDGSGLDGRADVLDGSDGELGTAGGGGNGRGRLLGNGRAGLLNSGGSLLDGSGSGGSGVVCRGSGGVALLDGSTGSLVGGLLADVVLVDGSLLGTTNVLLSQADVLRGCGAGSFHGLVGVLGGDFAELLGLLVGNLSGVVEVGVNELLVGDVDQGSEVDNAGRDEEQAPLGSDLDEEVADEGGEESLENVSVLRLRISENAQLTAMVAQTFSAKRMRWNSITKKLMSSSTSPVMLSRVSRGIV